MKVRSTILVLLGLLGLAVGWLLWPHAGQRGTVAGPVAAQPPAKTSAASAVAPQRQLAEDQGAPSTAVTNRLAFRLANTTNKIEQLTRMPHAILLENAFVDTDAKLNLPFPKHLKSAGNPGAYIVQSRGAAAAPLQALLKSAGGEIISYIPNNAYLVRMSAGAASTVAANPLVQAVLPYEPYYKVQASLLGLAVQQKPLPPGQLLTLGLFEHYAAATMAQIEKMGGTVIARDRSPFGPIVRVSPPKDWTALLQLPGVQRLEPTTRRVAANDLTREKLGVATNSVTTNSYLNLTGANVLVEVNDTGIDKNHPALTGRVFIDNPGSDLDTDGHGTHVAGIIAGDGTFSDTVTNASGSFMPGTNTQFRGAAPLAKLFSVGFLGNDTNFFVSDQNLQEAPALTNALISNNSWVNVNANEYDLSAASFDAATRDALTAVTGPQPVLFVFAAGNDGNGNTSGSGGDSDSINSPGTAKNVITVGALEQLRNITNEVTPLYGTTNDASPIWKNGTDSGTQVAEYSARGNVGIQSEGAYGRFKPDVIAPGSFVISTRSTTWDTNAYFNVTNNHANTYTFEFVVTNTLNYYGLSVPSNAIAVKITLSPNSQSPTPFPKMPIYVSTLGLPDANDPLSYDFVLSNSVSIPPDSGGALTDLGVLLNSGFYFGVGPGTNRSVSYNLTTQVITTNDLGNEMEVLHALDDGLGAPPQYYRYETGTSMAAPAVSGVLALMQDFFTNTLHLTPSPALLKAMLINGARASGSYAFSVTNAINYQGWGVPNLPNSIPSALTNTTPATTNGLPAFFVDQSPTNTVATGDRRTYLVGVPTIQARGQALRVTLAWTDPPGNPASAVKLVNDLDLIVTNLATGEVFYGNNFSSAGSPPFSVGGTNTPTDVVNNVENIYLSPTLSTNYSITVVGRSVNVNAVTLDQTNIVQDFALVVSCGDGDNTNGITFAAGAPSFASVINPLVDYVQNTNGILFDQIAGGNAPWLSTNTLTFGTNSGYATDALLHIGQTNQWHFYIVTNTFAVTNANFTNAAFITFSPVTMATPRLGTYATADQNATRPEADIELYVSDTPAITNLDLAAISNCVYRVGNSGASLGRGGEEFVAYSNSVANQIYYVAVKCEDQMAGRFAFVSLFSDKPFSTLNPDGSQTVNGQRVPVVIPDGNNLHAGVSYSFGLALYPMQIRRVTVTNVISHENYGDLVGAVTHGGQFSFLNNHVGLGAVNFANFVYDDSGELGTNAAIHTDAPGSLRNFNGKEAIGLWVMNEIDDSQSQTGRVENFSLRIYPHQDLQNLQLTGVLVPPFSWVYEYVDVPVGYTNLLAVATNVMAPPAPNPMQFYLNVDQPPDFSSYLARVELTNGTPPGNAISYGPPLNPGRYWIALYNPNSVGQSNVWGIRLSFNAAAISTFNFQATDPVPILDDAVTYASTFVTNTLPVQSVNVGLRVDHERISDLAFHLISPDGTRYLLMENRGNQTTNGAGVTIITTNIINVSTNGGASADTNYFNVGMTSGTFPITYNFYTAPDQMTVYYGTNTDPANLILDTGLTNNPSLGPGAQNTAPQTIYVTFPPPTATVTSTYLTIVINQFGNPNSQTVWTYTAGGVLTNYYYLNFTEDTNKTTTPIKFAPVPFVPAFATTAIITTNITTSSTNVSVWHNSFEGSGGNQTPFAGAYFADGWYVDAGSVDQMVNGTFGLTSYELQYCIDLNGSSPGTISTNIPTTVGQPYIFSFAYARNPDTIGSGIQPAAQLSIGGTPLLVVAPTNINSWANLQWATTSVLFTATSTSTRVQFASQNAGLGGVLLDAADLQASLGNIKAIGGFETPAAGNYLAATTVDGWNVISNQVSVVNDLVNAYAGTQSLALASGSLSRNLTTVAGATNYLSFAYRGPGAVGFWRGENNVNDPINLNNGYLTNGATYVSGKVGQAFSFNGSSQFAVIPQTASLNLTNQVTIEFWMNPDVANTMNSFQGLVTSDNYLISIDVGNPNLGVYGVDFSINDGGTFYDTANANGGGAHVTAGSWHHVVGTYDGIKLQLYIDGSPSGLPQFHTGSIAAMTAGHYLTIGSEEGRGISGRNYWGLIDEPTVYNRALSASEIKAIYAAGAAGKYDPVASFPQNLAKANITIAGAGTTTLFGDNTNWQSRTISFVPTSNSTALKIDGLQPGMLMDSFSLASLAAGTNYTTNVVAAVSNLYYLPEQSLDSIIGMNPYGEWQLEILDNRAGATNNANLVSWQLQFTFAKTNYTIPTLTFTNGVGPITNTLAGGAIAWYLINVPTNADLATNALLFSTLPLNVWFSTNIPPSITNAPADVNLLPGSTGGTAVLGTNGSPVNVPYAPAYIVPGGSYYLGFQNPNVAVATYAFDVTFHLVPAAPTVTTLPATNITSTTAVLNAVVVPNGLATDVTFEYGSTTSYGSLSPSVPITSSLTASNYVSVPITGLLPGAVYHFRAVGTNALGTIYGGDLTFTNLAALPVVITQPATNITYTTATLKALVNPGGANTLLYFQYGLTTNYTATSGTLPITANLNTQLPYSINITGLTPGSIYHFRAVATNIIGTNYGLDLTFTNPFTGTNPLAFTAPATLANGNSAQLNGFATANGTPAYAWFEWGTSTGYGVTTPVLSIGTNYTVTFVTNRITGLITNLPYHFRLVVSNGLGVTYGFDQIFDQANVVAWGANYAGQIDVPSASLTNLVYAIGAGFENSLTVSYDNTVTAWGINTFRQTNVPTGLNTAVAVGGGQRHSLAMRSNRTVVAWGSNQFGQTNAPGTNSGIIAIAAGGTHNLALRTNGLVMAWGANTYGQTNVPARATNVVSVSAGDLHSLALRADGTVVAWGYNGDGETNVPPGLTNVVAISAGNYHNLALKGDGTVVAWGSNINGETNVPAGLTNIVAVAGGGFHSLALRNDGLVVAWGDNSALQTVIPPGLSNVVAIAGGGLHSLALSSIYGLNQTNNAPFWTNNVEASTVTMSENTTLLVTNTATDTNTPLQTLSYALLTNSLSWVTINAQGIITLTPGETNGPSTNIITTVVTDNGRPALSATNSFTLVVNEINTPPFWPTNVPGQTNYNVVELRTLTVTNTASDSDFPTNALTYALFVSPPTAGATITSNGIITWTPTEAEGPAVYTFTTVVTDTNPWAVNIQSLTATNSFTVTVLETNSPPFWTNAFTTLTINELETNTFNAGAADTDVPFNTLQYRLTNSPAWAAIDTNNGVITFLPLETNGPSTNTITVIVTDNGVPPLSAVTNFTVIVNEVNTAPFWTTNPPNLTINALNTLVVSNSATDADVPANVLTYALSISPTVTNATINPATGRITWLPEAAQAGFTYTFTTVVADTNVYALSNPTLTATNSFTVTVLAPLSLTNGLPQTNLIAPGGLTYYLVNVPANADAATNQLLFAAPGSLNVWFTTNAPPSIANPNDAKLLTNSSAGQRVLTPATAPTLLPGSFYWLAVQNTNAFAVNYGLAVDFHFVTVAPPLTISISSIVQTNMNGTNGFLLTWFAPTNYQFQVQWKDGLLTPVWSTFTNLINYNLFITPTNSQFQFFDDGTQSGGFNPTRFYQLLLLTLPNTPPVLPLPGTRYVTPLAPLNITNTATDADLPAQTLTYFFTNNVAGTNLPTINTNGIITWTPVLAQAGTTNSFTTIVTDNGSPNLSATNIITVIVYPIPTITSVLTLTNGVSLQWNGFTNQQFQVQWTTNLAPPSWTLFPDIITSTNGTFNFVDTNTPALLKFYQLLLLP